MLRLYIQEKEIKINKKQLMIAHNDIDIPVVTEIEFEFEKKYNK